MAESPTPVPDEIIRTEGPERGSFLNVELSEGFVTVERQELIGRTERTEYGREQLEILTTSAASEPSESGLALQRAARLEYQRLVVGIGWRSIALAGERFKMSHIRENDGTNGAVMKALRDGYGLPEYWVKAEPWPFPVPFREKVPIIDVRRIAETLGIDAVLVRDPNAGSRRQPTEVLLAPIPPEDSTSR